jgi:hypothetical protein
LRATVHVERADSADIALSSRSRQFERRSPTKRRSLRWIPPPLPTTPAARATAARG